VSSLPLLATEPGKQHWLWETVAVLAGILLALNVLLFVVVYAHRAFAYTRERRTRRFRASFQPVVDEVVSGRLLSDPQDLRTKLVELDDVERPVAATMLIERLRPASPEEREMTLGLLRELGAVDVVVRRAKALLPWRRALSLKTLGWLGAHEGVGAALEHLTDKNRYVRDAAVRALGRIRDHRALPELEKLFLDQDRDVAPGFAYEAVAAFGAAAAPIFAQGLRSPDELTRVSSCFGIASVLEPDASRPLLEGMLDDTSPAVRAVAAEMLGRIGGVRVPKELSQALRDPQQSVRRAAATALGSYDDSEALELLSAALVDTDRMTAVRAGTSLVRLCRLPGVGAEAREALGRIDAWPVEWARTLDAVGVS
jgi:HEAT repeat protein